MATSNQRSTQENDPVALHEAGCKSIGKNYYKSLCCFIDSAKLGYRPAIKDLHDLLSRRRSLLTRLDPEDCAALNDIACALIENNDDGDNKIAYNMFRAAAKESVEAKASLVYCKLQGIGVGKQTKAAFELALDYQFENTIKVFASNVTKGMEYELPSSEMAKKVKFNRQKNKSISRAQSILYAILFGPGYLVLAWSVVNDQNIRSNGGNDVDEELRGNAVGGACFTIVAGLLWSFLLVGIILSLVLHFVIGVTHLYFLWGFLIAVPVDIFICWNALDYFSDALKKRKRRY